METGDTKKAFDVFMKQKSAVAAVQQFIERFMDVYQAVNPKERELLERCVQQMFRRYYYSPLIPDTLLSPANITNTLMERALGKEMIVLPTLIPLYKKARIKQIHMGIACYRMSEHPFVKDMETFLKAVSSGPGIKLTEPGIPTPEAYDGLMGDVLIKDKHYLNMLSIIALDMGLMEKTGEGGVLTGKVSAKAGEFMQMEMIFKLRAILDATVSHFSEVILELAPELQDCFSVACVRDLLKNPVDIVDIFLPALKKLDIDVSSEEIDDAMHWVQPDELAKMPEEEQIRIAKAAHLQIYYDMFFLTPVGYYMQLIQPIYDDIYDLEEEAYELLENVDDFQLTRVKLFYPAVSFDLTSLGEALLERGKKPERKQVLERDMMDEDILEIIENPEGYWGEDLSEEALDGDDEEDEDWCDEWEECDECDIDEDESDEDEYGEYDEDEYDEEECDEDECDDDECDGDEYDEDKCSDVDRRDSNAGKYAETGKTGALLPSGNRKPGGKVYTFKVKPLRSKRAAKVIELSETHTLEDLSDEIQSEFDLEWGHLYSFFMSNKAWDSKTEYSDPRSGRRRADGARIGRLGLKPKQKFLYLFDYGDELKFEVEVTDIT